MKTMRPFSSTFKTLEERRFNTGIGQGTIIDQNPLPFVSVSDGVVVEGNSGSVNLVFTATLDVQSEKTISVDLSTGGGTATVNVDYQPPISPLSFLSW